MKEKKAFRWRMALYALVLLLFYVLQTARGTRLHVFSATPEPDAPFSWRPSPCSRAPM